MDNLTTYIILVVLIFFIGVGAYYIFASLAGPRKIEEIEKLLASGRIQAAIDELVKLIEKDDRNLKARFLLAVGYQKLGNHGAAVLELRQCLKIAKWTPDVTEVHVRGGLARSLLESRNFTEAKNEYLILTTLDPRNWENFYELGKLFFRSGVHAKAINFLTKAISLNEKHADSHNLLGQAQYHLAAYQDARASLLKAVQLKSDLHVAHYFLGLTLRYLQDNEWAIKEFEKAEKDEDIRVKAVLGKGMVLIDMEAYPRAISELERGLKLVARGSDTEINMRYLLGLAAEKSRDMHTAISNWEAIEAMKPGFRDVPAKLKQYSDFRMDDSIKDFMIASNTQFEGICRQVLTAMGQQILNMSLENDSKIRALTTEKEDANKRNFRKTNILVNIIRDNMTPISEAQVREFHEAMKGHNAGRGIIMTTGDITSAASEYATSRPIELYDTSRLVEFVRAATRV